MFTASQRGFAYTFHGIRQSSLFGSAGASSLVERVLVDGSGGHLLRDAVAETNRFVRDAADLAREAFAAAVDPANVPTELPPGGCGCGEGLSQDLWPDPRSGQGAGPQRPAPRAVQGRAKDLEAAANTEITGAALTTTRAAGDTGLTFPEASTASAVT
jgi:hypothetical protein